MRKLSKLKVCVAHNSYDYYYTTSTQPTAKNIEWDVEATPVGGVVNVEKINGDKVCFPYHSVIEFKY